MIGKRKKKERKPTAKLFALGGNAKKNQQAWQVQRFLCYTQMQWIVLSE